MNTDPTPHLDAIVDALRSQRLPVATEDELQAACARVLAAAGIAVDREVRLDARSRLDLWHRVADWNTPIGVGIAIECKLRATPTEVARQCLRYLADHRVLGLVLVTAQTTCAAHVARLNRFNVRIVRTAHL